MQLYIILMVSFYWLMAAYNVYISLDRLGEIAWVRPRN